ncbi:14333_t:CDS:2, partial [Racocetra fulgida]
FAQLKTLETIRQQAIYNLKLKKELQASIKNIQEILNERTQRLKLHDNYFLTGNTAIEIEIEEILFTDKEHYKEFDELYGQSTSEEYRLLQQKINHEESESHTGRFINTKIRLLVCCDFCGKYRCIYSDISLNKNDTETIIQYLENISYSCRSPLLPDEHLLSNQLYICQDITCDLPIERNYYSCRIKDVNLCYWCRAEDGILDPSNELKSQFKFIYPLCISCNANGREWSTRAPIVFKSKK